MSRASFNSRPNFSHNIQPDIIPWSTILWARTSWLYATRDMRMSKVLEDSFSWRYIYSWQFYDGLPIPRWRSKHERPSLHQWSKLQFYILSRCAQWSLASCRKHRVPWHYCSGWLTRYSRRALQMGTRIPMCRTVAQHRFCWNQFLCA